MTISTLTLLTLTGGLVLFKLGLMALAVVLLVRTLLPRSGGPATQLQTAGITADDRERR